MIREISLDEVLAVRHPVLRPGRGRDEAVWACDGEANTHHLGYFDESGVLVGVLTVFPEAWEGVGAGGWRLRGMATVPEVRGRGYGAALVRAAEARVRGEGGQWLWCDARVAAVGFYRRVGWEVVGEAFDIPSVGLHLRMRRRV